MLPELTQEAVETSARWLLEQELPLGATAITTTIFSHGQPIECVRCFCGQCGPDTQIGIFFPWTGGELVWSEEEGLHHGG